MDNTYDVIILGSGLGGSLLATVLAKQGVKTLVLEKGQHPRFAIGESTTPTATLMFKTIGERFDIPEIAQLGNFWSASTNYGNSLGIKHAFSFLTHEQGKLQDPRKANQLPTLSALGSDMHLFRQDSDAAMVNVAISYGADVLQNTEVVDFELDALPVRLKTSDGQSYAGQFLVDASGFGSPVVRKLGLRDQVCRYDKTRSRTIFTHLVNVANYDELVPPREHGFRFPTHQGTTHHLFEGGWCWVIPFNNHRRSTNRACSVGLNLSCDVYPAQNRPHAEQEFWQIVNQYPSIKRHFQHARPIQPWIGTDRMQFSCRETVGEHWVLMPHAAGFIDPLFSAGLPQTLSAVYELGRMLAEGRRPCDKYRASVENSFQIADQLVGGSYHAFHRGHDVWNAWYRVWVIGVILSPYMQLVALSQHYHRPTGEQLDQSRRPEIAGPWGCGVPAMKLLLDDMYAIVTDSSISDCECAKRLGERIKQVDFMYRGTGFDQLDRRGITPFTLGFCCRFAMRQPGLLRPHLDQDLGSMKFMRVLREEVGALAKWSLGNASYNAQRIARMIYAGA